MRPGFAERYCTLRGLRLDVRSLPARGSAAYLDVHLGRPHRQVRVRLQYERGWGTGPLEDQALGLLGMALALAQDHAADFERWCQCMTVGVGAPSREVLGAAYAGNLRVARDVQRHLHEDAWLDLLVLGRAYAREHGSFGAAGRAVSS